MSNEITEESADKEVDVIGLGCSKEAFTEHEEVQILIDKLNVSDGKHSLTNPSSPEFRLAEKNWQRFSFILDQYQEQPHLIDIHLENMLNKLIQITKEVTIDTENKHLAFRYLYFIAKVRGYKVVSRHLPHEVADLEPVLRCLELQEETDQSKWETHYGLLLWFSIIAKIPFHLQRFDANNTNPIMDRILNVCKKFLSTTTTAQDMASYLASVYITRPDVRDSQLPQFLDWIQQVLVKENVHFKKGAVLTLAGIFKHGQREHMTTHANNVLRFILATEFQPYELSIVKKPIIKLIQRLGLIFLKPRVAAWRYQRGSRSLAANLTPASNQEIESTTTARPLPNDEEDDEDVPDEIEEVLEEILRALRDKNRQVQYSAAKGLGRLTNRLPKHFADQVVESTMELFSLKESDMAWHGGCLALAELARRGLLLPQRLATVLPFVEQAMLYDELRGTFSVGSAVRDAACYLCWALARAYDPSILQPHVQRLARVLVIATVFDREVNCRRAAASAFQEHVGRQGTFPHGIDILTTCDYFAVGLRKNAYLHLSFFVAQYDEYRPHLIDHLVKRKIMHWDTVIRQLSAQALHQLTLLDPQGLKAVLVETILPNCTHQDLHLRHGSLLASSLIINALSQLAGEGPNAILNYLGESTTESIVKVCSDVMDERFWRGFGGDLMRLAVCHLAEHLSLCRFPLPNNVTDRWLDGLRECLASNDSGVQQSAVTAVRVLIGQYYRLSPERLPTVLDRFLAETIGIQQEARVGNALALGSMPDFVLKVNLSGVVQNLCQCALITPKTLQWAEARKNALAALAMVCTTVGIVGTSGAVEGVNEDLLAQVFQTLIAGLDDYTVDSRGDIGAIVRESAMSSIQIVLEITSRCNPNFLQAQLIQSVLHALVKQATEQIRRTRLLAAQVFSFLLYCDPPVPHIPQREELRSIVSAPPLDLSTEKECFELWVRVMHLDSYRKAVVSGFISSIGSLTESLVKSASAPFVSYLRHLASDKKLDQLSLIADDILELFHSNLNSVRLMPYIFNFIDHLCSSGCLDAVFKSISQRLFALVRSEMTSGSKPLKLLISSIDLYCHLLRGDETAFEKAIAHLLNMLVSRFPRVRKITATKLYETLLMLTDLGSPHLDLMVQHQDEILTILSDTDWDDDVEKLKPIKNQLRQLFLPSTIPSA